MVINRRFGFTIMLFITLSLPTAVYAQRAEAILLPKDACTGQTIDISNPYGVYSGTISIDGCPKAGGKVTLKVSASKDVSFVRILTAEYYTTKLAPVFSGSEVICTWQLNFTPLDALFDIPLTDGSGELEIDLGELTNVEPVSVYLQGAFGVKIETPGSPSSAYELVGCTKPLGVEVGGL